MIARQFDLTCEEIEQVDGIKFNAVTPLVVNSALTCELYLKAISLIVAGTFLRGHDLHGLLLRQTREVQEAVYREYNAIYMAREAPAEYRRTLSREAFYSTVTEVKDVFMTWRYAYELADESIRPGILCMLRLALRRITSSVYDGLWF